MSFTLVTGFLDKGRVGSLKLNLCKNTIFRYQHPMIIFAPIEFKDEVQAVRQNVPTLFIAVTFEKSDSFDLLSIARDNLQERKIKYDEHFLIETMQSLEQNYWMQQAIADNLFQTDYFIWWNPSICFETPLPAQLNITQLLSLLSKDKIFLHLFTDFNTELEKNIDQNQISLCDIVNMNFYIAGKDTKELHLQLNLFTLDNIQSNIIGHNNIYWLLFMKKEGSKFFIEKLSSHSKRNASLSHLTTMNYSLLPISVREAFTNIKKPRIAILVTGNIRTWEYVHKEWMKNYDCYAISYQKKYNYHPKILEALNGLPECEINAEQILSSFPFKKVKIISQEEDETSQIFPEIQKYAFGYYQFRTTLKAFELFPELKEYDFIFRTRFDINSPSDIIERLTHNEILYSFETTLFLNSFHYDISPPLPSNQLNLNTNGGVMYLEEQFLKKEIAIFSPNSTVVFSDTVFFGKPAHIIKLLSFCMENYRSPSSPKALSNPPHSMLHLFFETSPLKVKLCNFGIILRPPIYNPSIPRFLKRKLNIALMIHEEHYSTGCPPPTVWMQDHKIDIFFTSYLRRYFLLNMKDWIHIAQSFQQEFFYFLQQNQSTKSWYLFEYGMKQITKDYDLIIKWNPNIYFPEDIPIDEAWLFAALQNNTLVMPEGKSEEKENILSHCFWGPSTIMKKLISQEASCENEDKAEFKDVFEFRLNTLKIPVLRFPFHYGLRGKGKIENITGYSDPTRQI